MFSKHKPIVSEMRALIIDQDPTYRTRVAAYLEVNGFANVDTIHYHGLANTQLRRNDSPFLIVASVGSYYNSTWEIIGDMRSAVRTVAVLDAHDVSNDDHLKSRRADAYVSRYAYLILLGHNILRAIDGLGGSPTRTALAQAPRVPTPRGVQVLPFRPSGIFA